MARIALYGLRRVATPLPQNAIPCMKPFLPIHRGAYQVALKAHRSKGSLASSQSPTPTLHDTMSLAGVKRVTPELGKLVGLLPDENVDTIQLHWKDFLQRKKDKEEIKRHSESVGAEDEIRLEAIRLETVRQIRKFKILANYGDYLGLEPRKCPHVLKKPPVVYDEDIPRGRRLIVSDEKLWMEIADILELSEEESTKNGDPMHAATNVLRRACMALGYHYPHMRWALQDYALRGRTFYNDIRRHISRCCWVDLGKELALDLKEIRGVMAPEKAKPFEDCIREILDKYLDSRCKGTKKWPWVPSEYAKRLKEIHHDNIGYSRAGDPLMHLPSELAIQLARENYNAGKDTTDPLSVWRPNTPNTRLTQEGADREEEKEAKIVSRLSKGYDIYGQSITIGRKDMVVGG